MGLVSKFRTYIAYQNFKTGRIVYQNLPLRMPYYCESFPSSIMFSIIPVRGAWEESFGDASRDACIQAMEGPRGKRSSEYKKIIKLLVSRNFNFYPHYNLILTIYIFFQLRARCASFSQKIS